MVNPSAGSKLKFLSAGHIMVGEVISWTLTGTVQESWFPYASITVISTLVFSVSEVPASGSWIISAEILVETSFVRSGSSAEQFESKFKTFAAGQEVISTTGCSSSVSESSKLQLL